jgi:hypothetical protein
MTDTTEHPTPKVPWSEVLKAENEWDWDEVIKQHAGQPSIEPAMRCAATSACGMTSIRSRMRSSIWSRRRTSSRKRFRQRGTPTSMARLKSSQRWTSAPRLRWI